MVEIRLPDDLGPLMGFLRRPICHGSIEADPRLHCANDQCIYWHGFPQSNEQPVLINFEQSIFTRDVYSSGKGTASATYFIGARGSRVLAANEMPKLYDSVRVASGQTGKA